MVLRISITKILTLLLIVFLLSSFQMPVESEVVSSPGNDVISWIGANWQSLALIVSEVSALISEKYSGIVKAILSIFGKLLKKK